MTKSVDITIGLAGKIRFDQTGGGINYQCMPLRPEYNRHYGANGGRGTVYDGYIVGVEYQSWSYGVFPNEAHDENVPCAVCYAESRSSVLMIQAQRNCPSGWQKEYEGNQCILPDNYPIRKALKRFLRGLLIKSSLITVSSIL